MKTPSQLPPSQQNSKVVTARIPNQLNEKLEAAAATNQSKNQVITSLLKFDPQQLTLIVDAVESIGIALNAISKEMAEVNCHNNSMEFAKRRFLEASADLCEQKNNILIHETLAAGRTPHGVCSPTPSYKKFLNTTNPTNTTNTNN